MTSAAREKKFYVWDTYWDTNQVYSFGIDNQPRVAATLANFWAWLAGALPPGSNVLDVACGNGAAALILSRAAKKAGRPMTVTGIDEAAIDPVRTVPEHATDLAEITFRPRVAMEDLPFPDASFDAVISQFGFEFGNPAAGLMEAARVIKTNGTLAVLALPSGSVAVNAARKSLKQARYLLAESGLFGSALTMIREYYAAPGDLAEEKFQAELADFSKAVEKMFNRFDESEIGILSVIVSCLYKIFADRRTVQADVQLAAIETARTRLAHYAARDQAIIKAAVPDGNLGPFRPALLAAGFALTDSRAVLAQGHGILAFQIIAVRLPPKAPPPAQPQQPA